MLTDIVNSIKATLYDRAASPLFGAFAISWAIWNYRLLIVLTSAGEYLAKLKHIDDVLYPTWSSVVGLGIVAPLATALAFIYLYPWPARKVYEYSLVQGKRLRELRQKVEGVELLTVDESRDLRQRHVTMQIEFDRQIKTLQEERNAAQRVAAESADRITSFTGEVAAKDQELATLRARLEENEQLDRSIEARQMRAPDHAKQRTINFIASDGPPTREQLENTLWLLNFRFSPREGVTKQNSKLVHLLDGGQIGEGRNANEHTWRLASGGEIEFVQEDGQVHSRFHRKGREQWIAERDPTVKMKTEMQMLMPAD